MAEFERDRLSERVSEANEARARAGRRGGAPRPYGYARAAHIWNECIADYACENESIQPDLQARWEKAGALIDQAGAASP